MTVPIAFLARSRIHLKLGEGPARPVDSKFGLDLRDRAARIENRNAWKTRGRGAQFMGGGLFWGMPQRDSDTMRIAVVGLARGLRDGEILYALETDDIGGVFALRDEAKSEQRLFHSNEKRVRSLTASAEAGLVAMSVLRGEGTANLAVMSGDGSDLTEITEGDSLDLAPRWCPGTGKRLVYQTAGVGRDAAGRPVGHGPFAIHEVDVDGGEVRTLAEDPNHDFLSPQFSPTGELTYLRRPHGETSRPKQIGQILLEPLLMPFRFAHAIFQFLNFFTTRYTGKPLASSGDARRKEADLEQMMIWGNLVDAREAIRKGKRAGNDAPDLVPPSWQLVRRGADGKEETLAKGVLAFDLLEDGRVLYSNGSAVFLLEKDGRKEKLVAEPGIEAIVAL